jgi:putative glycosyltransferase (TIGR04348 family)
MRMLQGEFQVQVRQDWRPSAADAGFDALIALHARRSAGAIAAWAAAVGSPRNASSLAVVLTGTDLYRDVAVDPVARQSLDCARHLVVLQERGPQELPAEVRGKARVIFQSTPRRNTAAKTPRHLRAVMVGHLRSEKSPETLFAAARRLAAHSDILIDHIGAPLDDGLAREARETAARCPHYRWLGALPHEATRRRIQAAHVLVHASQMEGGAHAVMEAVQSGTPVLASRIDGNIGMLGEPYGGYFDHGDDAALTDLLLACRAGQTGNARTSLLAQLARQCERRAPLFEPRREQAAVVRLVHELLL